jgi:hypothetical protein
MRTSVILVLLVTLLSISSIMVQADHDDHDHHDHDHHGHGDSTPYGNHEHEHEHENLNCKPVFEWTCNTNTSLASGGFQCLESNGTACTGCVIPYIVIVDKPCSCSVNNHCQIHSEFVSNCKCVSTPYVANNTCGAASLANMTAAAKAQSAILIALSIQQILTSTLVEFASGPAVANSTALLGEIATINQNLIAAVTSLYGPAAGQTFNVSLLTLLGTVKNYTTDLAAALNVTADQLLGQNVTSAQAAYYGTTNITQIVAIANAAVQADAATLLAASVSIGGLLDTWSCKSIFTGYFTSFGTGFVTLFAAIGADLLKGPPVNYADVFLYMSQLAAVFQNIGYGLYF